MKQVDYDSFGSIISDSNSAIIVPFGFAGGLHDKDIGLVRFGYRDYDPTIGIFISKDPIGFAGGDTNLYRYTRNNPTNWIDPSGLQMVCTQTRIGINTTVTCYDSTTNSTTNYSLTEPAPVDPSDPYGPSQQLSPGLYSLLPRPSSGPVLPQGSPVYTTPGQTAGTIITPSGGTRGGLLKPVGPHVGTRSEGCPLFSPTPEGRNQKNIFYNAFNANVNNGGTVISLISLPGFVFGGQ